MKKSLYNLLSMIPIYGTFLKFSSKGEMRLCSPLYQMKELIQMIYSYFLKKISWRGSYKRPFLRRL